MRPRFKNLAVGIPLAAVYFVAGKLGLKLAFVNASATAVWPPAGIALAAFLIFGYGVWPWILLGAFLVNLTTAGSVATSLGIAVGNTLEGFVGATLVNMYAQGRNAFHQAQDIFKFAVLAAVLSTTVSATIGVTSLCIGGFADWRKYGPIWLTWWLGDAAGDLIVAPVIILWSSRPRARWNTGQALESMMLLCCLFLVGQFVFGGLFPSDVKNYPLEFLCIPFLIWAAFRFGQRIAGTAVFALSGIAIWGTLHGLGPFVRGSQNESLVLLQAFMGVIAVMTLSLAAVVSEGKRIDEALKQMAGTDSLTNLANHRRFLDALEEEIQRSKRTERPFSVLLLDLDGLKKINDSRGHLVGSRALCRLAEVLRIHCRSIDTAARFGGDEFALILVETEGVAAQQVARRISKRLEMDEEPPALTVSIGVAEYPQHGKTMDQLLGVADRALYEAKAHNTGKSKLES